MNCNNIYGKGYVGRCAWPVTSHHLFQNCQIPKHGQQNNLNKKINQTNPLDIVKQESSDKKNNKPKESIIEKPQNIIDESRELDKLLNKLKDNEGSNIKKSKSDKELSISDELSNNDDESYNRDLTLEELSIWNNSHGIGDCYCPNSQNLDKLPWNTCNSLNFNSNSLENDNLIKNLAINDTIRNRSREQEILNLLRNDNCRDVQRYNEVLNIINKIESDTIL